jgi:hypothetical protein
MSRSIPGRRIVARVFVSIAILAIAPGRVPLLGQSATEPLVVRYARGDFSAVPSVTAERASEISSLRRDVRAATGVSPQTRAAFLIEAMDAAQHQPASRIDPPWVVDEAIRGLIDLAVGRGFGPASAPALKGRPTCRFARAARNRTARRGRHSVRSRSFRPSGGRCRSSRRGRDRCLRRSAWS